MISVLLKSTAVWFVILLLAIFNGGFREYILISAIGSFAAFLVSGILLSLLIFLTAYFSVPWFGKNSSAVYWITGFWWLLLTIIFEFSFGRLVQEKPWSELLAQYSFQGGNVWLIVLMVIIISPWISARLRNLIP